MPLFARSFIEPEETNRFPNGHVGDDPVLPGRERQRSALEGFRVAKALDPGQTGRQRGGQLGLEVGEDGLAVDINESQPVRRHLGERRLVVSRIYQAGRSALVTVLWFRKRVDIIGIFPTLSNTMPVTAGPGGASSDSNRNIFHCRRPAHSRWL